MPIPSSIRWPGKAALLVNPFSRQIRRRPELLPLLRASFDGRGPLVVTQSADELPDAMAEIRRSAPDVLFVCGGDGTLRQTFTQFMSQHGEAPLPRFGILRGGTMNTVATSLNLRHPPEVILKALLDHLDNGDASTRTRHLLKVNDQHGFIFGVGGFSRFIEYYNQRNPTPLKAFTLLMRTLASTLVDGKLAREFFTPFEVNLWRDGQPWLQASPVTNVSASSIRHIGFGFKPYYGAEGPEGMLGFVIFRTVPKRMLFRMSKLYLGRPIDDPTVIQAPASRVLLKVNEPMQPMLDGDLLPPQQEFDIRVGPALEVLTP